MELISKDSIYDKMRKQEDMARERVLDTPPTIKGQINPAFTRYSAQLNERTAFREIVFDEPTVKAITLDEIKQARKEIEQLKHKNTGIAGYRWWNNAIENCLHEIDRLIESEG